MERFKFIHDKNFQELPKTSGVYCFTDKKETLYIGKAINIQSRVKNHFNRPSYRDDLFINQVKKIGFLETASEIDALILEANLIKKHQPKFNVVWRDDKNYFYVAITKSDCPMVYITHQKTEEAEYVGPFVEGTSLKKVLRFLRKVFPYYSVKKHSKTKCTYCHLDLCPGPLLFENPPSPKASEGLREYRRNLKRLILILQGKRVAVLNSLRKEMRTASKEHKFEEAGKIRDKIYALQQIMAHTRVIEPAKIDGNSWTKTENILKGILNLNKNISQVECYDVSNIQGNQATGSMVSAKGGPASGWVLTKSQYKKFKIKMENTPNDIAMLKETLQRRFAHPEWEYPEIILIDGGIAQLNVAINTKNEKPETKEIKVISIAKRNKELYIEGPPSPKASDGQSRPKIVLLKTLPREIYNLVLQLDDEAHRFAITYHKKLRRKNLLR
jgi:excinuclease ABC subunit C